MHAYASPDCASRLHPAQCRTHACHVRARFPSVPVQCAGYPGRLARRRTAPAGARATGVAAGGSADSAGGDAALAAVHAGGRARGGGESGIPHARRIRRARAGAQSRPGRRRPGHGHHAVAPVPDPARRAGQRCGVGAAGRVSGRWRCAQAVGAGRRAGQRVREIPGLAARLVAALGKRCRCGRPAGAAVAQHRRRAAVPCAPHRPVSGPLCAPGRPAAAGFAEAAVRLRHPQCVPGRAARAGHAGAGGYAAFLSAHAHARLLGRSADAVAAPPRGRGGGVVRRAGAGKPVAAGLGRGRARFHGIGRRLRSGAPAGRDRRLRRPAGRRPPHAGRGWPGRQPAAAYAERPVPSPRPGRAARIAGGEPARPQPAGARLPHAIARAAGAARPTARLAGRCALRPAAAAARDRGAVAGHRPVRAVSGRGVRWPWQRRRPAVRTGRRQPAGQRAVGRCVPHLAGPADFALWPARDPGPAGQCADRRGRRAGRSRAGAPARLAARRRRALGAGCGASAPAPGAWG